MAKETLVMQMMNSDNGGAALCMILAHFGRFVTVQEMREHCISSRNGSSPEQVCDAAAFYGLDASFGKVPLEELTGSLPRMVRWKKRYYTIVKKIRNNRVTLMDPLNGEYDITLEKFESVYTGEAFDFKPNQSFRKEGRQRSIYSLLKEKLMPYSKGLLLLAVLSSATVILSAISLNYREKMIDDVMATTGREGFWPVFWGLAITWILYAVVSIVYQMLTYSLSRRVAAESSTVLYKKLFRMPMSFYEKTSRGELIDRLEQNRTLGNSLISTLVSRIFELAAMVFYVGLIYTYSPILSTVLIVIQVGFSVAIFRVQSHMVMLNRSNVSMSERLRSSMLHCLNAIDTIKANGTEGVFFNIWNSQMNECHSVHEKELHYEAGVLILESLSNVMTSAAILFLGAYLIATGHFTMGAMSALQVVFVNVSHGIESALLTSKQLRSMRTNIERINDISDREIPEEIPMDASEEPDKLDGSVQVTNLTFRYNQADEPALRDISFTIEPGEMVALVGASGCGKSTLLKLVAGLYRSQDDSIRYQGRLRREISDIVFHSSVASVDQEVNMFQDTISRNLKMWDNTVEDFEMILAARDAQIHNRIIQNNSGYDSIIYGNGSNYSGGEQQRLELARALAQEPTLLVLDEFTSALDSLTEEKVFRAIRNKGTSCLIAAHRMSTVVECHKVICMDHGRIVEMGTPEELYELKGIYYEMMREQ